jgi:hypothetical protein
MLKKKIWANFQRIIVLFAQKLSLSPQKYGFGIRDQKSEIRKNPFRIPDPGVKKAQDPGSGSATRHATDLFSNVYLPGLLGQHELWPGDVGIGARGRNPPELHRLIARAAGQQAIVERREGKVSHGVRMTVDPGNGGLVGAAAGRQRQHSEAGAQGVPVEGHVRGTGRDVVAA